jgi:hypothetical protein
LVCFIKILSANRYKEHPSDVDVADLVYLMSSMRTTSLDFAQSAVRGSFIPVVHIKGARNMFSMYDIKGEYSIAFFSAIDALTFELFDTTKADGQMSEVVEQLALVLLNLT